MTKNPEFVRNLWLVHRPIWLIATPAFLGAIFIVIYLPEMLGSPQVLFGRPQWEVYAFGLFYFVTVMLGAARATTAITTEVQQHTWDGQRMSAIPPWQMAWGKLFGSTAYAWYGGLCGILLYVFAATQQSVPSEHILKNVVVWILIGIVGQSAIFLAALLNLIDAALSTRGKTTSAGSLFVALPGYAALPLLWIALPPDLGITWYGWWFGALDLLLLTAVAFAAWTLTGAYFAMRREFQYTNSPLAWIGFAVFTVLYAAGFDPGHGDPLPLLVDSWRIDGLLPLYVGVLLVYASALSEPIEWQLARRFGRAIDGRDWREAVDMMPRPVYALALLAIVAGTLVVVGEETHWPTILGGQKVTDEVLVAAFLFAARDTGLIILLSISMTRNAAGVAVVSALAALLFLLPTVTALLAKPLLPLFWPAPATHPVLTLLPPLIQMAVVWVFLIQRMRRIHAEAL